MFRRDTTTDFTSQISGKLGSQIATGSFCEVYRCTGVKSSIGKTEVAVKVLRIDPRRTVEKLTNVVLRELRVWLELKHPNIVPLLGTAQVNSPLLALVSQWMSSGTLFEYLDDQATTIKPSAKIGLVKGIAEGVNYLHSKNVTHGDLHPGNVLIDGSGNPRLTDFGLATVAEDPELQWGMTTLERAFDPRWRAPEVIGIDDSRGPERPTFKSDIYSFGSVMFFTVSGIVPWQGNDHRQIYVKLSKKTTHALPNNIFGYYLIKNCWSWEPGHRPEATRVLQVIAKLHLQEESTSDVVVPATSEQTKPTPDAKVAAGNKECDNLTAFPSRRADAKQQPQQNTVTESHASGMSTKNIVFFGSTGVNRSSVINLIAGKERARTSPDMERCTLHMEEHPITFDGCSYKVFDTIGLEKPQLGMRGYLNLLVNAHSLIAKLRKEGGIDLLLFCVRAGRTSPTMQNDYRLFYEFLCDEKVPVVLVVTGLERECRMEDWWDRNRNAFHQYGIKVADHACITVADSLDGRHRCLYEESRRVVRDLVIRHTSDTKKGAYAWGEAWYKRFMLWELTVSHFRQ